MRAPLPLPLPWAVGGLLQRAWGDMSSSLRAPLPIKLGQRSASPGPPVDVPASEPSRSSLSGTPPQEPPVARLQVVGGALTTQRPTPSPPFRLMPPSQAAQSRAPTPAPSLGGTSECDPATGATRAWVEQSQGRRTRSPWDAQDVRLRAELRSRALGDSHYGRVIIGLLTYPWVQAPSGLAAMVFPPDTSEEYIDDCARHINDLVCGATAYRSTPAGVLAVYGLGQLNRLLVRSGLSPIAPQPVPPNWGPLAARQPPDFLQETWRPVPSPHNTPGGTDR